MELDIMQFSWVDKELEELSNLGIDRKIFSVPENFINFSSNDYLNLSKNDEIIKNTKKALDAYGLGSTSARLLSGNTKEHEKVEEKLKEVFNSDDALVYSAGYLANIGVISSLVARNDLVISDKLVHASLIDGINLSFAKHLRFKHNDLNQLEEILKNNQDFKGKKLVVVESIYSMDGDGPDFKQLLSIVDKYQCMLLVDEAHAFGVFGKNGRGRLSEVEYNPDSLIITSTFSKSLGAYGGFVICSKKLKKLLISSSRSFIFNTSLPPAIFAGASAAMDLLKKEDSLGKRLLKNSLYLKEKLENFGFKTLNSFSQIIPVLIGDAKLARKIATELYEKKIFIPAIVAPTVRINEARLRASVTLFHQKEDLDFLANTLFDVAKKQNIL